MAWKFEVDLGKMFNPKGGFEASGYSGGDGGKRPDAINNPHMQEIHCAGPIPLGVWIIGEPIEGTHLGPIAIPLTPAPGTKTFLRNGFFIHGDNREMNRSASDGCVIMPHEVRVKIAESKDKRLEAVLSSEFSKTHGADED